MAELHVQRKKNSYWWLWLLLAIIIIGGAIYYYLNYYQKGKTVTGTTTDSTYSTNNSTTDSTNPPTDSTTVEMGQANLWSQIDFNSPDTTYSEVTDKNIKTQSNAHFVIYSMSTQNLFVDNKSDLSNEGKQRLNQIGNSINKRFNSADVKIYDQSDTSHPDRLAVQRAESISNYLVNNSKLDQSHITVYQRGEQGSVPDKNNMVNIVVKR
jgi:outer membrane protein OmpA-like peptidoglycan-associated protein